MDFKAILRSEGDYEAFTYMGLACRMMRHEGSGVRLGYVGVPRDHWAYGLNTSYNTYGGDIYKEDYLKIANKINDIEVHGGLTYADSRLRYQPETDLRWFGFDCHHAGDLAPKNHFDFELKQPENYTYKNKHYCKTEVEKLARQLQYL